MFLLLAITKAPQLVTTCPDTCWLLYRLVPGLPVRLPEGMEGLCLALLVVKLRCPGLGPAARNLGTTFLPWKVPVFSPEGESLLQVIEGSPGTVFWIFSS